MVSGRRLVLLLLLALVGTPVSAESLIYSDGFEPLCPGNGPSVTPGAGSALLLRGTVVTTATAFAGDCRQGVAALAEWRRTSRRSPGRSEQHHCGVGPGKRYLRALCEPPNQC